MSSQPQSYDLPKTQQAAPPNFYSQTGGQGSSGQSGSSSGADSQQDPDHLFLDSVTKVLKVLDTMGKMKPKGQSVEKFTKAAAMAMKAAVTQVFGKGQPAAGSSSDAGDGGDIPSAPDQPLNTSAASAGSAAGGAGGAAPTAV
jgi:hypothetical protein